MKENCEHFGVRTEAKEQSSQCQGCKKEQEEQFEECTKETKRLESTSVTVVNGETVEVKGPLPSLGGYKPEGVRTGRVSTEERNEGNTPEPNEVESTTEKKEKRRIRPRVKGIIQFCNDLLDKGESTEEVIEKLTQKYIQANYPEEAARGRAKGIAFGQIKLRKKNEQSGA